MSAEPLQSHVISGSRSRVELVIGSHSMSQKAPLVIGSVPSGMDAVTAGIAADKSLKPAFKWINSVDSGAWMGLVESSGKDARPTLFIQNNGSRFYRERYETWFGSEKVWLDWWFATLFVAIDLFDTTWKQEEIVIWHPVSSSNPWGSQMLGVLVEVVTQLADNRDLNVQRIGLGCPHDLTVGSIELAQHRVREAAVPLREPVYSEVNRSEVGCPNVDGLRLIKVEVGELELGSSGSQD